MDPYVFFCDQELEDSKDPLTAITSLTTFLRQVMAHSNTALDHNDEVSEEERKERVSSVILPVASQLFLQYSSLLRLQIIVTSSPSASPL